MIDVKAGDKVKIVEGYGRSNVQDGEVIKVARVWVTIKVGTWNERKFRLDDQTDGSNYGMTPRFYTLDQWAEREARRSAQLFLREQGIDVRMGGAWFGREVDLAAMLKLYVHSEKAAAEEEADRGTSG